MNKIGMVTIIILGFYLVGCSGRGSVTVRTNPNKRGHTTCNVFGYVTSSSTPDCDRFRIVNSDLPQNQLEFMVKSYEQVSEEASQGHGNHLHALSSLLACKETGLFAQKLRSDYSTIFNEESTPESSLRMIHIIVNNDLSLRNTCSAVSRS